MKDPSEKIREAIYTALNGNLSYNAQNVDVFSDPADDDLSAKRTNDFYVYVLIGDQTMEDVSSKDKFHTDNTFIIDIVTGFKGYGSKAVVNDISSQVLQILTPSRASVLDLGVDFVNTFLYMEWSGPLQEETGTHRVLRKLIRFRLEVEEN